MFDRHFALYGLTKGSFVPFWLFFLMFLETYHYELHTQTYTNVTMTMFKVFHGTKI